MPVADSKSGAGESATTVIRLLDKARAALRQGERSQVEGSDRRWRGAIAGGGERLQVKESDRRWRGAIAGEGERLQSYGRLGSGLRPCGLPESGSTDLFSGYLGKTEPEPEPSVSRARASSLSRVVGRVSQDGSGTDRSPPPLIAPLRLRSLPSCDRSLPPPIAPLPPPAITPLRVHLQSLPSTCDRSPLPAIVPLLRSLPSTCYRSPPPVIAPLHL